MLSALALAAACSPQVPPIRPAPRVRAELIAPCTAVVPGQTLRVALALDVDPGWHVYWRNPGEAGGAPRLEQLGDPGPRTLPLAFPAPQRIIEGLSVAYGFAGPVTLLAELEVPEALAPGARFRAELRASWLVCEEVCLAEEQLLRLELPVLAERPEPGPRAAEVEAAVAALPDAEAGLEALAAPAAGGGLSLRLSLPEAFDPARYRAPYFFCAEPGLVKPSGPQRWSPAESSDGPDVLALPLYRGAALPERLGGLLVLEPLEAGPRLVHPLAVRLEGGR